MENWKKCRKCSLKKKKLKKLKYQGLLIICESRSSTETTQERSTRRARGHSTLVREESPHTLCLQGVQQSWGHRRGQEWHMHPRCHSQATGGTGDRRTLRACLTVHQKNSPKASPVNIAWGCGGTRTRLWWHQDALDVRLFVLKLCLHRYLYTVHVHRTYTQQHMSIFVVSCFVHYITGYRNTENIGAKKK